jgi:hypothetical protein
VLAEWEASLTIPRDTIAVCPRFGGQENWKKLKRAAFVLPDDRSSTCVPPGKSDCLSCVPCLRVTTEVRPAVIARLNQAREWKRKLDGGEFTSISQLARAHGIEKEWACRIFSLLHLAPEILEFIDSQSEKTQWRIMPVVDVMNIGRHKDPAVQRAAFEMLVGVSLRSKKP